jgi:hypothetical protein
MKELIVQYLINVTQKLSADDYMATIQIQSRRPVFKSSYFSPTVNYIDESFVFQIPTISTT